MNKLTLSTTIVLILMTTNSYSDDKLWNQYCGSSSYSETIAKANDLAESENEVAQYCLGVMYEYGMGIPINKSKAIEWQLKSANKGYKQAQNDIGHKLYNGIIVKQDYGKAFYMFNLAAEQNYAKSQSNLGLMYEMGNGVQKSFSYAIHWYQKAAIQGYAKAQYNLAKIHQGWVESGSTPLVIYWYTKAAEQGYANAQYRLGLWYSGRDRMITPATPADPIKAKYWNNKALEQGYKPSINCSKISNQLEQLRCYTNAAELGYAIAQFELGQIYSYWVLEGVEHDQALAASWYLKAAEQGYVNAQYWLGLWYSGRDRMYTPTTPADPIKARYWYNKALEQGHKKAKRGIEEVAEIEAQWAAAERNRNKDDHLYRKQKPSRDCSKIYNQLAQLRCYTGDKNAVFTEDSNTGSSSDSFCINNFNKHKNQKENYKFVLADAKTCAGRSKARCEESRAIAYSYGRDARKYHKKCNDPHSRDLFMQRGKNVCIASSMNGTERNKCRADFGLDTNVFL